MSSTIKMDMLDIGVLVIYFLAVLLTGVIAMFTSKRGTVSGFFLAGRFMTWLPIGASLFASNIGSQHFIGLAGSGAASGISVGAFELNGTLLLQLMGWVFLPVYIASGVCTLPEYMRKRFGGNRIQVYLACLSLLLYVLTKISVNFYSGSLFLAEALQWNIWLSVFLQLAMTALITIMGGLAAVLYTDTLQFFVMLIGSLILAGFSYAAVGGFQGLLTKYPSAIASVNTNSSEDLQLVFSLDKVLSNLTTKPSLVQLASTPGVDRRLGCGLPSTKAFILLREIDDPDMPYLGFLLGQTPASIWYWCADQVMVQRALAAKSLSHAQGGTLFAGFIKLLPLFIMVIPGMISRVLYPNEVACIPGDQCLRVCGQRSGCSNLAYPKLVMELMPHGLRGLMLAVLLAALISDLTSIFNSASALFTIDVYERFRRKASQNELMLIGRLFVVILVAISIAWIPIVQSLQGSQLYIYIQSVSACLTPPIAAVYMLAVLWSRMNETGAFYALLYGLVIGLARLVLTIIYSDPVCGEVDTRPWIVAHFHYMYFGVFSFGSTLLVMILVSMLCGTRPTLAQTHRLTYFTVWTNTPLNKQSSEQSTTTTCDTPASDGEHACERKSMSVGDTEVKDVYFTEMLTTKSNYNHEKTIQTRANDEAQDQSRTARCLRHATRWICGCEDRPFPMDMEPGCCRRGSAMDSADKQNEHMQKLTNLDQDPRSKCGLRVGLCCISVIAIFCCVFFSVYFGPIDPGPLPMHHMPSTNMTTDPQVEAAIEHLKESGLIKLRQ